VILPRDNLKYTFIKFELLLFYMQLIFFYDCVLDEIVNEVLRKETMVANTEQLQLP